MSPVAQQSRGRDNVRPQPWLSEGTCKQHSLLPDQYLFSVVLSLFLFLTQIFLLLFEGTAMRRAGVHCTENGNWKSDSASEFWVRHTQKGPGCSGWKSPTALLEVLDSHAQSILSMTQVKAEAEEPLPCLGMFCSMPVPRKGMNASLIGQTGKDMDEVQHQFLQASWWQHRCELRLLVPASSSCCSYSNHPNTNHELQLPMHCQLHPKLMPPRLPGVCTLKPREQPQPLLFGLALLA